MCRLLCFRIFFELNSVIIRAGHVRNECSVCGDTPIGEHEAKSCNNLKCSQKQGAVDYTLSYFSGFNGNGWLEISRSPAVLT